jgi:RNA methyltransferase, TrmH family
MSHQRQLLITSMKNPRVAEAVRLRDRRHRQQQGRTVIDGVRELRRAVDAGVKIVEAFVCEPLCHSDDTRALVEALPQRGCEMLVVTEPIFQKLAFGQRAEGVLGVAEVPRHTLELLSQVDMGRRPEGAGRPPLLAVIEAVEKPGNLGAVLRSADAAGVSAVIAADPRTDLYNPNAIRASMGTIFTVPVCEAASGETLAWLRERGFAILAARVDAAVSYTEVDYRGPAAIVLGSEAAGLSSVWTGSEVTAICLPMLGAADSLNVSVTAAVLFYEALRQRGSG